MCDWHTVHTQYRYEYISYPHHTPTNIDFLFWLSYKLNPSYKKEWKSLLNIIVDNQIKQNRKGLHNNSHNVVFFGCFFFGGGGLRGNKRRITFSLLFFIPHTYTHPPKHKICLQNQESYSGRFLNGLSPTSSYFSPLFFVGTCLWEQIARKAERQRERERKLGRKAKK